MLAGACSSVTLLYLQHAAQNPKTVPTAEDKLEDNPKIFSCWRSHANGMWPADDLVSGGMWPESSPNGGRCTCSLFACTPAVDPNGRGVPVVRVCCCLCFITAGPITKLFAWGGGEWRTCATRDDEPRPVVYSAPFMKFFPCNHFINIK